MVRLLKSRGVLPHAHIMAGHHTKTNMRREDIEAHFWPHTGFDSVAQSKIDEMNYEHYHLHDPADEEELPLKWHEAAPCAQ